MALMTFSLKLFHMASALSVVLFSGASVLARSSCKAVKLAWRYWLSVLGLVFDLSGRTFRAEMMMKWLVIPG